jgi:hypothetical protein
MPISARFPCGRSQHFTFARRNFLQGLASAILPFISQPQPVLSAFGRCKPEFSIGDAVRTSWEAEPGVFRLEVGEIVGTCWHPTKRRWEYLIVWDGSYFDEYLTDAERLELNYHA